MRSREVSLDGASLWQRRWPPQPIYLGFGTASSPVFHPGRVYVVQDDEQASQILALDAATVAEV